MLLDQNTVLSDKQTITTSAASTHTIDATAAGNVVPGGLFAVLRNEAAFAGATSVAFSLQTSDQDSFATLDTLVSATFTAAQLANANQLLLALPIPAKIKRYIRAYYTVTGTATAGSVTCFLTDLVDQK